MPIDTHEISFDYKHSLGFCGETRASLSSQSIYQQKIGEQSDFSVTDCVF